MQASFGPALWSNSCVSCSGDSRLVVAPGAAEKAVSLQNGGNHSTPLGETAYETDYRFVSRWLGSVSHAAGLEASPSCLAAEAVGFALDAAALALGPVEHDLVLWRLGRRTLRHGASFLRGLSSETTSARQFAPGIPDGPGSVADAGAAGLGERA